MKRRSTIVLLVWLPIAWVALFAAVEDSTLTSAQAAAAQQSTTAGPAGSPPTLQSVATQQSTTPGRLATVLAPAAPATTVVGGPQPTLQTVVSPQSRMAGEATPVSASVARVTAGPAWPHPSLKAVAPQPLTTTAAASPVQVPAVPEVFGITEVSCKETLDRPLAGAPITFPQAFSWSTTGSCTGLSLAFATSASPSTVAVFSATGASTVVSAAQWSQAQALIGAASTYYWTVGESHGGVFTARAAYRSF